ncbi:MAG: thioredoxin-disulfide reductase [Clostridia bacterium]|nr:thioredoxin-disulfide reductase [Clostridia bacterium]
MERIFDTVIIGGGPAGYTAALYAARAGLNTAVIEKMSIGGQMTLTGDIENYPGFDEAIDGISLGMKMQNGAEKFGAKTVYDEVLKVDFSEKIKKITTFGGEYLAKTVIIAAGANPKSLGLENEEKFTGRGIHYCAHCDGRFYKDKTVAVVGGGNSAAADALYLSRLVKKVYLIHRRDSLRATKIYHEPLIKTENIEFLWNSTVTELLGENKLSSIVVNTSSNSQNLVLDGVFVSIGRRPATDFLNGVLPLDEQGYIIAGEDTKTSIDGVFAAGDVRIKALRQIVTATADGAVAASAAEEYLSAEKEI